MATPANRNSPDRGIDPVIIDNLDGRGAAWKPLGGPLSPSLTADPTTDGTRAYAAAGGSW